ncbi:cysteine proteinase [Melanomma pulvis-pyrius CBS 109.77]|uniref:Cysteine proteinase n=1 Tax=Melanomma pulvis-pyrius CBS 109.77 TaxID=1314802 RepID=A0A6A6XDA6_9PLEO|nr:cysteine proteinase [Melanomma pulvis-pyrius CBS 109.77]
MTLASQLEIPPTSSEEINRILSEAIAYQLINAFPGNSSSKVHLNLTARQNPWPPSRPRSVDWRNRWGVSWLTTVQSQGRCDNCWAFAAAALVESMTRIEHGIWAKRSEGDVRDGAFTSNPGTVANWCAQSGSYIGALNWVQEHGVADPGCWPWQDINIKDHGGWKPCSDRIGRTVRIPKGVVDLKKDVEGQKQWIDRVGPIITVIDMPWAFQDLRGSGVYTSPPVNDANPRSQWAGQHFPLIVGYDDDRGAWLVKNSWGTWWGDNGYGWIKYGEMRMDDYWHKTGLRYTNPDPWSTRRLHNGNMIFTGRTGYINKNFELVACNRRGYGSHLVRAGGEDNDFSWTTIGSAWAPPAPSGLCVGQPALIGSTRGDRDLDLLYWSAGNNLVQKHYNQVSRTWIETAVFGTGNIGGYPSLIQYNSGQGFASVVRHLDGSLVHYESTQLALVPWLTWRQVRVVEAFGVRMSGPSLIQPNIGSKGNYYTVAVMEDSMLQLFWYNKDVGTIWMRGERFSWLIGKTPPVMIQTNYATATENDIGDFAVFVVMGGRVLRYRRDNSDLRAGGVPIDSADSRERRWHLEENFLSPDGRVRHVWSAMQGPFSQNLEVVVELEDGRMQTLFRDWGCECWKLSMAGGGSIGV